MKTGIFLFPILVFVVMSCSVEEKQPPDITGKWMATDSEIYNIDDEGAVYNKSHHKFWEHEKVIAFNNDKTWEEKHGAVSYRGSWEIQRYKGLGHDRGKFEWELIMRQSTVSKFFGIQKLDGAYLILHERNDSWNNIITYVKME